MVTCIGQARCLPRGVLSRRIVPVLSLCPLCLFFYAWLIELSVALRVRVLVPLRLLMLWLVAVLVVQLVLLWLVILVLQVLRLVVKVQQQQKTVLRLVKPVLLVVVMLVTLG